MNKQHFRVLGLMSGTSLDGLDVAVVDFWVDGHAFSYAIRASETVDYPPHWQQNLKFAHLLTPGDLAKLNEKYGKWLGETTQHYIAKHHLTNIHFIASHGHTVHHQPEKRTTVQIGNGPQLARITGIPVVCDFRLQDVLLGGQGAPLVPIGDKLLFAEYDACLNLGGFANISFNRNGKHLAFDICATNIVLNALCNRLNLAFDENGAIARSGKLLPEVLAKLNALPYFTQQPPKSLGREWTDSEVLPLLPETFATADLLRTFCEHAAQQVAQVCADYSLKNVLVTGGGAFNSFFMERMQALSKSEFILPEKELITHKEAVIFALLGLLRWLGLPNCLASVTGAPANHSAGRIYLPAGNL